MCRDGDGEHSAVGGDTGSCLGEARIGACRVKQPRDRDTDTAGCPLVEREAWVYLLGEPTIGEVWSARDLMMALGPSLSLLLVLAKGKLRVAMTASVVANQERYTTVGWKRKKKWKPDSTTLKLFENV